MGAKRLATQEEVSQAVYMLIEFIEDAHRNSRYKRPIQPA
jgi:hypothetical protein